MASHRFLNHSNQVRDSYDSGKIFCGSSKAQTSLSKILHIISSSKLRIGGGGGSSDENTATVCGGKRGFDIDLNLRLGTVLEIDESNESPDGEGGVLKIDESNESPAGEGGVLKIDSPPEVCDGFSTAEKSSEGECEYSKIDSSPIEDVIAEKAMEVSEITTNLQFRSLESDNNNGVRDETKEDVGESDKAREEGEEEHDETSSFRREENQNGGFLGLLIEAARLISGEFESSECELEELPKQAAKEMSPPPPPPSSYKFESGREMKKTVGSKSRRREEEEEVWYGDFEDVSPVVRSKRGRSQVLPYRYRDSVIEPWKRLQSRSPPTVSKKGGKKKLKLKRK